MTQTRDIDDTAPGSASASERLYGVIGGVALLLAVYFLFSYFFGGGPSDGESPPAAAVPALVLESPGDGEVIDQPAAIVFRTTARMERDAMGPVSEGRHLHLMVGETEVMAGPSDIAELGGGRYRWPIPRVEPGEYKVRVLWSGTDHRPLAEGASETIRLRLR